MNDANDDQLRCYCVICVTNATWQMMTERLGMGFFDFGFGLYVSTQNTPPTAAMLVV